MGDDPLQDRSRRAFSALRYASVGLEFAVAVVLGWWIGHWLEMRYDFAPWGGVGGVIVGFAAGVKALVDAARRVERESREDDTPPPPSASNGGGGTS